MNTSVEKKQDKSLDMAPINQSEFDFESWAKQVRPQLLASVQKRSIR